MKLSFWMFGETEWTMEEVAQRAKRWGYHGVDLRVARRDGGQDLGGVELTVDSTDAELDRVKTAFDAARIEISSLRCYTATPSPSNSDSWRAFEEDIARHARLAQGVNCRRLKIMAEQESADATWDDYLDRFWASVAKGLDAVPSVTSVVIENHNGRANAQELLESAERSGDPRFGCGFACTHALIMQEDTFALIDRHTPRIHTLYYADRSVSPRAELGRSDGRYFHVRFERAKYGEGIVQSKRLFTELPAHGFKDYIAYKCEEAASRGALLSAHEDLLAGFPAFVRGLSAAVE